MIAGNLHKLSSRLSSPVQYTLQLGPHQLALNDRLGHETRLRFAGAIYCVACGRKTPKSFHQGHCFPCMQRLARCDLCVLRPELCHYALGTCREPDWGRSHCMRPHYVYLAYSSGLKVGITRESQVPTRWIDQGATQALPVLKVQTRHQAGLIEVAFKAHVADRTDWRKMLKGEEDPIDLERSRDELFALCAEAIGDLRLRFGADAIAPVPEAAPIAIRYPVLEYPAKVTSLSLDKTPAIEGILLGIKGQYLILDTGVLNIRKFTGYNMTIDV